MPELQTRELIQAFMDSRAGCTPRTLDYYRWALTYLESQYVAIPDDAVAVREMARTLPPCYRHGQLSVCTRRSFYKVMRVFYAWVKANHAPGLVVLPYASLGRKRRK